MVKHLLVIVAEHEGGMRPVSHDPGQTFVCEAQVSVHGHHGDAEWSKDCLGGSRFWGFSSVRGRWDWDAMCAIDTLERLSCHRDEQGRCIAHPGGVEALKRVVIEMDIDLAKIFPDGEEADLRDSFYRLRELCFQYV